MRSLKVRDVPFLHGTDWKWDEGWLYWEGRAGLTGAALAPRRATPPVL